MNDNRIEIKEQRKDWLLKGILLLILMTSSAFIALLPLLSSFAMAYSVYFYTIGGIAFAVLTTLFVLLLYKECNPDTYMILSAHGFIDRKNVGEYIEIEWTNIASVKILGKTDMPFLGISLENSDMIIARMKKNEADEMIENINENLPAILIAQNEIRIPLKELKELLTKFVREARALEKDIPKKPKNNPFSTDDVLRAFGKLPKEETKEEESNHNDKETAEDISNLTEAEELNDVSEIAEPENNILEHIDTPVDEEAVSSDELTSNDSQIDDPFYNALQKIASENIGTNNITEKSEDEKSVSDEDTSKSLTEENSEEIDMPEEMRRLLSKAKSSKIAELGKMLNDNDTPFTYSTEAKISAEEDDSEIITEEVTTEINEEASDSSTIIPINDNETTEEPEIINLNDKESDTVIHTDPTSFGITIPEASEEALPDVEIEEVILNDAVTDNEDDGDSLQSFDDINNDGIIEEANNGEHLPFEITLDYMIENALKSEQDEEPEEEQLVPILEVPKIELPEVEEDEEDDEKPKQKKRKSFILHEKKN